jgi:hypothetical protein
MFLLVSDDAMLFSTSPHAPSCNTDAWNVLLKYSSLYKSHTFSFLAYFIKVLGDVTRLITPEFNINFGFVDSLSEATILHNAICKFISDKLNTNIYFAEYLQLAPFNCPTRLIPLRCMLCIILFFNPFLFASFTCTFSKWWNTKKGVKRSAQ